MAFHICFDPPQWRTWKLDKIFLLLSSFTLILTGVHCDCNADTAVDYSPIPPANYDRNFSSISSVGKNPLGFNQSIWYYTNAGHPNPCFKVTGAANRRLEIMFETFPSSRLCVKMKNTQICSEDGTGRFYRCLPSPSDTVYLEFYCDNKCGEYDVRFWYRFVLGDPPALDPEDHWCDKRDLDEYPQNLIQLPPDYPIQYDTTTVFSGATSPLSYHFHFQFVFTGLLSLILRFL